MKPRFESRAQGGAVSRWRKIIAVVVLPGLVFAAIADGRTLVSVAGDLREACGLMLWSVRSGEWRAERDDFVAEFEYVFCPNNGAGARLDFDSDQ